MTSKPNNNYLDVFNDLKERIRRARLKASNAVNTQLLQLYWEIGQTILNEEKLAGWGAKIVDKLAKDLKLEFSDMKGLSARNLRYMRDFANTYPSFPMLQAGLAEFQSVDNKEGAILQVSLAKLSWYHHITLLDKVKESDIRIFYIRMAIENGWSRDIMVNQIERGLHKRQGALTHNFTATIPEYESELAQQLFKDPYKFEFLGLGEEAKEKDLEQALINQIEKVLLELGEGFALYGRQYKLTAGGKEYFIDLLFYHTKLRRYVVIELKIGEFLPEYVGKMNLYLGLTDDKLKDKYDEATIGLILCKTKNKIVAEYALRDTSKPIGIAEYRIAELLPEDIKGELPSIEEIEAKLDQKIELNIKQEEEKVKEDDKLRFIKEKLNTLTFSYFLDSNKLHIAIKERKSKVSVNLGYVPVDWDEKKQRLGWEDPHHFALDDFERYLSAVYLDSKLEKVSEKFNELKERIKEMLMADGITEIARRVFNWSNKEDGVPTYDDFVTAFEQYTKLSRQEYQVETVGTIILFKTEGKVYEMDSYEGKTAVLKSFIENKSYDEIYTETHASIWNEIYIDAGIEKEKFIPGLINEWDIYWENKYEEIKKLVGKTAHLDKIKERSWRSLEVFIQMYNEAGNIITLACDLDDSVLYPLTVITMMDIFNPQACYEEYCELEFFNSDEWESISLDETDVDGTILFIRPYPLT
jgi:predicted nuclease of restriction endonuclease-like (RecB) superfamily